MDGSRKREAVAPIPDLAGASWIWSPGVEARKSAPIGIRYFRKEFTVPEGRELASAMCVVAVDNSFKMFLNGRRVQNGNNFKEATAANIKEHLHPGKNILAVEATNEGTAPNPAGVLAVLRLQFTSGEPLTIVSDATWRTSESASADWMNLEFNDSGWKDAQVLGAYGISPWGKISVTSGELFLPPAQFLRKQFVIDNPVKRATVYASALGNYELYLNGRRVGDAYFTPGWTDYDTRVYYNTFDVTDYLKKGANAIGGILADGWYSGHIGWMHIRDHYGPNPRFAAQLHIEFADGSTDDDRHGPHVESRHRPHPRRRLPDGRDLRRPQGDPRLEHRPVRRRPLADGRCHRAHHGQDRGLSGRSGAQVPGDQAGEDRRAFARSWL